MIPLSMPWIVTIGDPLGIDELGANKLLDRGASVAVSQPQTGAALPDSTLGYSGVDLIMINASGGDLLRQLNPNQQEAIVRWVESGGRLLLTLGLCTNIAERIKLAARSLAHHRNQNC